MPALTPSTPATAPAPIFILAPLPRSGTNYLWDLLRLHRDCAPGRSPIWEDYLLRNGHHLDAFADAAVQSWDPVWGSTSHLRPLLLKGLGDSLIEFMSTDPQRRLVTKSPSIENLELFFDLFPSAHLVLLVRDGRDVVASGMKTFGWQLEEAARAWAAGVDRITAFLARPDVPHNQCSIVHYEALHEDAEAAMRQLLPELGLPLEGYDFSAATGIPVRGSSTFRGAGRDDVHWDPVPREPGFNPVQRWRRWDQPAKTAFAAAAGTQLRTLGYAI